MKPTLLVLAAGMGSRYGGLKQMDPIGPAGETIIDYSINDAIDAGFGKIVFVIRESFKEEFVLLFNKKLEGKITAEYVTQEIETIPAGCTFISERSKPWGTGHAILMAKDCINEPFAVINADDYYGREAFFTMADFLSNQSSDKEFGMVGYHLGNTISENGSVSRGVCSTNETGHLLSVVERTQIEKIDNRIVYRDFQRWVTLDTQTTVSMNFWGFTPLVFSHLEELFVQFLKEHGQEMSSEFYIPSVVSEVINQGNTSVRVLKSDAQWFGVTYKEDKEKAVNCINNLIAQGVYPKQLWGN